MSDATISHSAGTIQPRALADYRSSRAAGTIVHPISNSSNPDYTFRPFDLRAGSFALVFATDTDADAAFDALTTPQQLVLTSTARPGINMTFIIPQGTAPEIAPGAAGETIIRVDFQEVPS